MGAQILNVDEGFGSSPTAVGDRGEPDQVEEA